MVSAMISSFSGLAMAERNHDGRRDGFAHEGGHHGGGGGGDHDPRFYVCTASANDDSGLFFLGMDRTLATAYGKASDICNRQAKICTITCENLQ